MRCHIPPTTQTRKTSSSFSASDLGTTMLSCSKRRSTVRADDIELFHSVLVEYVTDVRVNGKQRLQSSAQPPSARLVEEAQVTAPMARAGAADEDLRGQFVLMDQDMGRLWARSIDRLRLMRIRRLKRGGVRRTRLSSRCPKVRIRGLGFLKKRFS